MNWNRILTRLIISDRILKKIIYTEVANKKTIFIQNNWNNLLLTKERFWTKKSVLYFREMSERDNARATNVSTFFYVWDQMIHVP